MASCSQVNSLFQAYIDGELGHAEKCILEEHLRGCDHCQRELIELRASAAQIFEALSEQRLVWGLRSRVLAHLPEMDAALKHGSHPTDPRYTSRKQRSQLPWLLAGAASFLIMFALLITQGQVQERGVHIANAPVATTSAVVGMVAFSEGEGVLRLVPGSDTYQAATLKSLVHANDKYTTLNYGRLAFALIGKSLVKVNYNSTLTVEDNRRVSVSNGLTYFEVGHQKRHFYVDTPNGEIQVYGTAFVVDVKPTDTTVTVVEGDILVRNDVGIAAVSKGEQLVFRRNERMPKPTAVEVGPFVAWADEIVPDASTMELFRQSLEINDEQGESIPADIFFMLRELTGKEVQSLKIEWIPDGLTSGHCSFAIRVTDGTGKLQVLTVVDNSVFDVPGLGHFEVPFPEGPITGMEVLEIRFIPNYTDGEIEANITKVTAPFKFVAPPGASQSAQHPQASTLSPVPTAQ